MVRNMNQFWAENKETIFYGALASVITVALMTVPYIKYFLL